MYQVLATGLRSMSHVIMTTTLIAAIAAKEMEA